MEKFKRILKWRKFSNGLLWSIAQLQLFSAHGQFVLFALLSTFFPLNGLDVLITK